VQGEIRQWVDKEAQSRRGRKERGCNSIIHHEEIVKEGI
jgi:hypothetical protein